MAIKSAYITSDTRPNVRLYVEQTAKNTQYGTLNVTVQMNGSAIDVYNGPTINMSTVDASYVWTGSNGTISSSSWTNVYSKSGIIVWYTSASTRTITINTNGSYSWDRTEEGGDAGSELYAFGGDFEMSPKATPSSPTITPASSSVTLGSSVNITTANGTSGAMTATIGNHTETIMTVGNGTNAWSPTLATWGTYVTGASAVATLRWNNVSTTITVAIPENSSTKPEISSIGTTVVNGLSGLYVQSRSKVTVNVTASGKYGATITAYGITMNGVTYTANGATSGVLNTSGTNTISVTVTDSRGFTSTSSTTITVEAYSAPTLSGVSIYRSDSSGNADASGTYLRYIFTPTITSVNGNNAKNYRLQRRAQGTTSWTNTTLTALTDYTSQKKQTVNASLSTTTVYEARLYIQDSFQTVYSTIFTIPTAAVIMDFNTAGTGGGIGMYTQAAGRLDIGWKTSVHDGSMVANIDQTGLEFTSGGTSKAMYPSDRANSLISSTQSTAVSVPSSTSGATTITSVTLGVGLWLLCGTVTFPANTSGYRLVVLSKSSNSSTSITTYEVNFFTVSSISISPRVQVTGVYNATSSTTIYLNARQSSGSALNTTGNLFAVRIG